MRKLALLAPVIAFLFSASFVHAQQGDVMFGVGTLMSPSYTGSSQNFYAPAEKGGAYPAVSADVIFHKRFGINGEVSWRASQAVYNGYQPYRPILYDFNAMYQPRLGRKLGADLMAGIGGESIREYQQYYSCSFVSCTDYTSSNHFMEHLGGGIRYYFWHHVFVRPEVHYYHVQNNAEFNSNNLFRVGGSIGYTISPE